MGKRILAVIFFGFLALMGVCEALSEDITKGVVRLHVVADSDREADQQVKLLVRDGVLEEMERLSGGAPYTLAFAEAHKADLERVANAVLRENGMAYMATVETGNFSFPTKEYENITLPAGRYDAVRVTLGQGDGENWWCVMFPPLCFTKSGGGILDDAAKEMLKGQTGEMAYGVITNDAVAVKPALKAVELWQAVKGNVERFFCDSHR